MAFISSRTIAVILSSDRCPSGSILYIPADSCRMYPARTSSRCEATTASAGTSFSVGVKLLDMRMTRLPLLLQLAIDRLLDLLVRLRAVDEDAVDEERRRAVDARR